MSQSSKEVHKCVLCDAILNSKEELQQHFRKHANKEIDGDFNHSRTSAKAKRKASNEKPAVAKSDTTVTCDVCGEQFTSNTAVIQHQFKKHPEHLSKYYCPHCGMQFTVKDLLNKHIKIHDSDKRPKSSIKCEDCGVEFYFQSAKEYHNRSAHKRVMRLFQPVLTPPPSKKIRINNAGDVQSVYYCHLCGSDYVVKFNLQKHLEKAHTEEERTSSPTGLIRCTTCDALFYNQQAYSTHTINHQPDDLYVTSEQQRLQTVSRVDQDFDIRRVLPLAEKYLPSFKLRPKQNVPPNNKLSKKSTDEDKEELSPPSSPGSSDSDSDVPLSKISQNMKKTE